jgi:NAD(P)-dependent dehydrogenase (short-subunit alcohol dehydrogenase family)
VIPAKAGTQVDNWVPAFAGMTTGIVVRAHDDSLIPARVLSLARQFGGQGVTVNNLAPGAILTARNRDQMAIEGEILAQRIPAGRLGRPDDLVGAAMLLCSDAGRYINGVNLFVDGGRAAV